MDFIYNPAKKNLRFAEMFHWDNSCNFEESVVLSLCLLSDWNYTSGKKWHLILVSSLHYEVNADILLMSWLMPVNLMRGTDTHMMDRQDQEGPSSSTLSDDSQETWVDRTEAVVLHTACDWHAIKAVLLGGGLTKHVAELGAAVLRTPCHLREGRGEERSAKESHPSHSYEDRGFNRH